MRVPSPIRDGACFRARLSGTSRESVARVVSPVMAAAVHEETRRAGDAARVGAVDVLRHAGRALAPAVVAPEPVLVEADIACVPP